jgi:alkylated DNA repair dioxygenase AlkB
MATRTVQQPLFGVVPALPEGMRYELEVLSREEEASLLERIRELPLQEAQYRQYTARRRTLSYGGQYDFGARKLDPGPPVPAFLLPLREKIARWAGVAPSEFQHALVTEYRPGTPLGWHRDVPDFEVVVGVSLAGRARMRLRPYRPGQRHDRKDAIALELEPRSAYVLRGEARWGWQHCIAATKELRYSITFRTPRRIASTSGAAS